MQAPLNPLAFISSRSRVIASLVTLPLSHHQRIPYFRSGLLNCCSSNTDFCWAAKGATRNRMMVRVRPIRLLSCMLGRKNLLIIAGLESGAQDFWYGALKLGIWTFQAE